MVADSLFGHVPIDWEKTTLGEACARGGGDIQTGPFGSQLHSSDYVPFGIPSIMPQNIGDNRIITDRIARITLEDANRLSRYRVQIGDIVYSRRGDVKRRALIHSKEDGWLCGTGCLRVRFNSSQIDPLFVSYYLGHPNVQQWIVQHAVGATMPNLNTAILAALPFVIPPLSEQRAIAHILGTFDDKIELNRQMNETLEAIASTLFKSWFVDFDPVHARAEGRQPYGMDAEIAAFFPDSFEDASIGEIPKGWKINSLGELFPNIEDCVLTGPFGSNLHSSDYRSQGVPLILVKHVSNGRILEEDLPLVGEHKFPELDRYLLKENDIVFTRVGAVGRSAYIYPRQRGWLISGQMLRVRLPDNQLLNSRYLAQVYMLPSFVEMVENYALGSTRPSLNTSLLRSFRFLTPPIKLQDHFVQFVAPLDSRIQSSLTESHILATLRDALLPKLLSCEIRMKDAEKFVEAAT